MKIAATYLTFAFLTTAVFGRNVPSNVRSFYNRIKNGRCTQGKTLQKGFFSEQNGPQSYAYCQDTRSKVLYIHGTGKNFANMDVDCDGDQTNPGDGRCGKSTDTQSTTAFQSQVQEYSKGKTSDLNANIVPYVVFGNYGTQDGYTNFDPKKYNIQPLSVMAVVCGNKLIYGVWGDVNGDDGPPVVGEASISLATACYGSGITGNNGHDQNDVLYIAFPGSEAATVEKNAKWSAKSYADFEASIQRLGNKLIKRLS